METLRVRNGDVELAVHVAGAGPTIVLLHGWPDTSALWEDVAKELVREGYRVAVPDLRGCGQSSKPASVEAYAMGHLVADVACILDALGSEGVTLVGHDWGASLAWVCATYLGARVERLVVLSVGHPTAFRSGGLDQQIRSWYTLLFAHEGLGEAFLRHHDYEAVHQWMAHPRAEEIVAELERDGQIRTHLLWYRANLPPDAFVSAPPVLAPVAVATLGVWSSGDRALTEAQMRNSAAYCVGGFDYVRLEGFGHWLPLEAPAEVTREILSFVRRS